MSDLKIPALRGAKEHKELQVEVAGLKLGVAVVSGLANARALLEEIKAGRKDIHFIEVMTCPGGCVGGGGQPIGVDREAIKERMKALYDIDRDEAVKVSHLNTEVKRLYEEFLGEPLGHKSHELLHTTYQRRDVLR
jgi:NADH-quinone oxidoreductase subunit G/NADP-reducing hydrogenase subunit HndD